MSSAPIDAGNVQRAGEIRDAPRRTPRMSASVGRLADEVRDIEREEVAGGDEPIDRLEADMIGIDEVRACPAQRLHRRVGLLRGRWAARCAR